jgi:putative oxidoreductase
MVDNRTAPYALLLLRVSLGVMFIAHALMKIVVFTVPGFAGFLAQVGFPPVFAWPVVLAELLGGIALVVGFYGRAVAVLTLPVLIGAMTVHLGNGWVFSAPNGGWEYPLFLVIATIVYALGGDGALALRKTELSSRERFVARTA